MDEQWDEVTAAVLRARRGDDAAAAEFVRATQAQVWRLCAALGDRAAADDLTQETYARAFAGLHRFAGRSAARTWLLAIARRVCADYVHAAVRTRARIAIDTTDLTELASGSDPADTVSLRAVLDGIDPDRREAFVLTQLVGLSYAEAADVCSCPVGTIRSRVARARTDLCQGLSGGSARRRGTA